MRPLNPPPEQKSVSRDATTSRHPAASPGATDAVGLNRDLHGDTLADVRDGLTREERVVLWVLHETQKERGGRSVPTTMLWGRVCEHFYISPEDLSAMLARLGARKP
jgi:hypothetical protein